MSVLDDRFLSVWIPRLREAEPDALAILVEGSYARGTPGPHSDLDVQILTAGEPRVLYRSYIVEQEDGRLLHITVGAEQIESWLAGEREPASWSFYLPADPPFRLLWATAAAREMLATRPEIRPGRGPELQDFVECASKVKNAYAAGDELALRFAADELARYCPSVLAPLNRPAPVRTPYEALRAVLDFAIAPPGYRDDMLLCLGLSGRATMAGDVYAAALRLARGVVDLLAKHVATLPPGIEPDMPRYLADGTLRRYLEQ